MSAVSLSHPSQILKSESDIDPEETREWLEALLAVIETEGIERAHFLIESLVDQARRAGANLPYKANTAYINTIPPHMEPRMPGDAGLEQRIRSTFAGMRWRWWSVPTASRIRRHIATFASAATLTTSVSITFHAFNKNHGETSSISGHAAPGIRACLSRGAIDRRTTGQLPCEIGGNGLRPTRIRG